MEEVTNGYNTIQKLEQGIVALDQSLTLTSIAVSMKRIADQLTVITGNTSGMGYESTQTRNTLRDLLTNINDTIQQRGAR